MRFAINHCHRMQTKPTPSAARRRIYLYVYSPASSQSSFAPQYSSLSSSRSKLKTLRCTVLESSLLLLYHTFFCHKREVPRRNILVSPHVHLPISRILLGEERGLLLRHHSYHTELYDSLLLSNPFILKPRPFDLMCRGCNAAQVWICAHVPLCCGSNTDLKTHTHTHTRGLRD